MASLHARLLAEAGNYGGGEDFDFARYQLCLDCGGTGCRICEQTGWRDTTMHHPDSTTEELYPITPRLRAQP